MSTIKFRGDPVTVAIGKKSVVELPPRTFRARLTGFLFDTDKTFLLPGAMHGIRRLKTFYDEHPGLSVLVTGHTDSVGPDDYNVSLSVDRARAISAFLRDAVDEWMIYYSGSGHSHAWGAREDQYMLATLPEKQPPYYSGPITGAADGATREAVRRFQADEGLTVDGDAGPQTRRALVKRYMALENTSLPAGTTLLTHGCGPFHQAAATGPNVDEQKNRRVEVFFFEGPVTPAPRAPCPSPGCPEYPIWKSKLSEDFDVDVAGDDVDPLSFSLAIDEGSDARLQVLDGSDTVVRTLAASEGERSGGQVRFTFVPTTLPNPTLLRVLRDGQEESFSGRFDPTALRDALESGDLDAAARIFDGDDSGGGAGGGAGGGGAKSGLAGSAAVAPPSASDLQLRVQYDNDLHAHRFVGQRNISLVDQAGAAISGKTSVVLSNKVFKHAVTFDVPKTATGFTLTFQIDDPIGATPILLIKESASISRTAPGPPIPLFSGPLNRRVQFASASYSTKSASTFVALDVDVTFLDVTDHVKALPGNSTFSDFLASKPLCDYVVLEFTGNAKSKHVNTWIVAIPPSYDRFKRTDSNIFLFFRNELMTRINPKTGTRVGGFYLNSDDCDYGAMGAFFQAPAVVGTYIPTGADFQEYNLCGWDKQLANSKKEVMAVFPIPLLAGFLLLDAPANAPEALRHVLVALYANRFIGRSTDVYPTLKRLAVGGWSSGTNRLYDNWAQVVPGSKPGDPVNVLDELYFFDGLHGGMPNLVAWFNAKPGRVMRLLGTAYTETSSFNIIQSIKPPNPDATAIPGDLSYFYTNADYKRALTPQAQTTLPIEKFKPQGTKTQNPHVDVSDDSEIFLVSTAPVPPAAPTYNNASVKLSWTDSKAKVFTKDFPHLSETELASLIRYFVRHNSHTPVVTEDEFNKVALGVLVTGVPAEAERAHKLRHPWSIAGGVWDKSGTVFTGYVELVLSLSKF